jgi:abscisic-aldehyde oxidase
LQVADTQKHADMAAKLAVVEYDTKNLEQPILTVEDAVKRSSFFEVHPMFYPEPVGDVIKGMEEAERKIISSEVSQNCFQIFTAKVV